MTPMSKQSYSVLKLGDPLLRIKCDPVTDFELANSVSDQLWATLDTIGQLYDFRRGTGIAAPQIGQLHRMFVAAYNGRRRTFVNPEVVEAASECIPIREGCLSFFDYRGMVPRPKWAKISAVDLFGKRFQIHAEDEEASLYLHEIDHLDGILYFDHLPGGETALIKVDGMPRIP